MTANAARARLAAVGAAAVLCASNVAAQPAPWSPGPGVAAVQDDGSRDDRPRLVSFRADVQRIAAGLFAHVSDTWLNAGNRTLQIPHATGVVELRGNGRVDIGSRVQVVVRPRVRASADAARVDGLATDAVRDARFEMTEAYIAWRPTDSLAVTYGLQNFQWGPAEVMSPSNRIFHEVGVFRDPLYSVRGRHLARVNVSAGRQWSIVTLAEIGATSEAPFRAGASFRRAGQAKIEYATASGGAYVGVTAGVRGGEPPWAGGYASVELPAGFAAYADVSFQRGAQAWYPVPDAGGTMTFDTAARNARGVRAMALGGLRYTYSAVFDARLEVLHQGAGYTRAQVEAAPLAVTARPTGDSLARWLSPGLELLGRGALFVSAASRDLPPADRLDLHLRYIRSLTDRSGATFLTASLDATDSLVLFGSLVLAGGPDLSEFTRLARAGGVAGLVWSW